MLYVDELTDDLEKLLLEAIGAFMDANVRKAPRIEGLSELEVRQALASIDEDCAEHLVSHLQSYFHSEYEVSWEPSPSLANAIEDLCCEVLLHQRVFGRVAQLNFVGFGANDVLGGQVTQEVHSFYAGRYQSSSQKVFPFDDPDSSTSWASMIGANEAMDAFAFGVGGQTLQRINRIALRNFGDEPNDDGDSTYASFSQEVQDYLDKTYWKPFLNTLGGLSIRGLVRFAEAMLEIESLRAASGSGTGTVGGEIDSLVITKRNGVQWCYRMIDDLEGEGHSAHPFL